MPDEKELLELIQAIHVLDEKQAIEYMRDWFSSPIKSALPSPAPAKMMEESMQAHDEVGQSWRDYP